MCGIFGAVGKYSPNDIRLLALLNMSRGTDATGFYNGKKLLKEAVDAKDFLRDHRDYFLDKTQYIMGHTRLGTHGSKLKDENAHPFIVGTITGTHNGMINNTKELKEKHGVDYKVDSQYIFYLLNTGIDKLNELWGYYCLAYVDSKKPKEFNLLKHDGQLSIVESNGVLYYSSNGDDLFTVFGKQAKVKDVPTDTKLTIDIDTLKIYSTKLIGLNGRFKAGTTCCGETYTTTKTGTGRHGDSIYNFRDDEEDRGGYCESDYDYEKSPYGYYFHGVFHPYANTVWDTNTKRYTNSVIDKELKAIEAEASVAEKKEEAKEAEKEIKRNLSSDCTICGSPRFIQDLTFIACDEGWGKAEMCGECWAKYIRAGYSISGMLFSRDNEVPIVKKVPLKIVGGKSIWDGK